jgi:hypothetical protein
VAATALGGYVYAPVGWATHYHADYVVPYWAQSLDKLTTIGRHIFYGWKGAAGTGAGFTSRYAGAEPDIAAPGAVVASQAAGTVDPSAAIVEVTSAERPVIAFRPGDALAASLAKGAAKVPAADGSHPSVAQAARWAIGGPASPAAAHAATTTVALAVRKAIPADAEHGAKGPIASD